MNAIVGDMEGNAERVRAGLREAREIGADIAVFPELCLTGYPPEDLLFRRSFLKAAEIGVRRLARRRTGSPRSSALPKTPRRGCSTRPPSWPIGASSPPTGRSTSPTTAFSTRSGISSQASPRPSIPSAASRSAFSSARTSGSPTAPGADGETGRARSSRSQFLPLSCREGPRAGEDARRACQGVQGLDRLREPRGRPGRDGLRRPVARRLAGRQDDRPRARFPGGDHHGGPPGFEREVRGAVPVPFRPAASRPPVPAPPKAAYLPIEDEVFEALVCGTRDYVEKNRFPGVVIGLSGGIDSSLVAAVAVGRLGRRG